MEKRAFPPLPTRLQLVAVYPALFFQTHLQRVNYEPVHFIEEFVGDFFATSRLQVDPEIVDGPLAAVDVVVVVSALLDGDVRQVDEHVVQFVDARVVFHRAEAAEDKKKYDAITCLMSRL